MRFNDYFYGDGPARATPADVLGALVDGSPLPGRWGLIQALLKVWAGDRLDDPRLRFAKRCFDTAGVVRAYRKSLEPPGERYEDPIQKWTQAHGMVKMEGSAALVALARGYLSREPCESIKFDDERDVIEVRQVAGHVVAVRVNSSVTFTWRDGPYLHPSAETAVRDAIARSVWRQESSQSLQLLFVKTHSGPDAAELCRLEPPGDFVSTGAESLWQDVSALGARCAAFLRAGWSRRLLLYGPPGTGKTTLAYRAAEAVGDGRTLRLDPGIVGRTGTGALVEIVRFLSPDVVLLDDLDRQQKDSGELLHALSELSRGLVVIGTVNTLETLDPALLRPGRFDEVLEVKEPGPAHREAILRHYCQKFTVPFDEGLMAAIDGFSPADIREVVLCGSVVGLEHMGAEIDRVRRQRGLYSDGQCAAFLRGSRVPSNRGQAKEMLESA